MIIVDIPDPVSYTHLDVYKRQLLRIRIHRLPGVGLLSGEISVKLELEKNIIYYRTFVSDGLFNHFSRIYSDPGIFSGKLRKSGNRMVFRRYQRIYDDILGFRYYTKTEHTFFTKFIKSGFHDFRHISCLLYTSVP